MNECFYLVYDKKLQTLFYSESQGIRNKKAEEILRSGSSSISATFTKLSLHDSLLGFVEFYLDLELIDCLKFSNLDK